MARATRRLVLARDNYRCVACGATEQLEVHHIVPRRLGGRDEPSNLVTLCAGCHMSQHNVTPRSDAGDSPTLPGTDQIPKR